MRARPRTCWRAGPRGLRAAHSMPRRRLPARREAPLRSALRATCDARRASLLGGRRVMSAGGPVAGEGTVYGEARVRTRWFGSPVPRGDAGVVEHEPVV